MIEKRVEHSRRKAVAFMEGGGRAGALMRSVDWASTPLGPVDAWPESLKTFRPVSSVQVKW